MQHNDRRLEALRQYHASRPGRTRQKLNDALDRMLSGETVVIDRKKIKFNKSNLAKESEVSIHTLLKKERTGERRFEDVLARLKTSSKPRQLAETDDERDHKIAELRESVVEISNDKLNLACQLDRLGLELLTSEQRAKELQQENTELARELLLLRNRSVSPMPRKGRARTY